MAEPLTLLALLAAGWLWLESMRAHELAMAGVVAFCARQQLQLLDASVAFVSMALRRDDRGRLRVSRTYRFEFSDSGDNRLQGRVMLLGGRIEMMHLQPYSSF